MLANQQSYERGLEDLKLTIDATVEKYKRKLTEKISLERLITECDLRNSDNKFHIVYGVNKDKQFMPTVTSGEDLSKYKVVQNQQFACNLMHVGRDVAIPVALNNMAEAFIISPAYLVFEINTEKIIPEFFNDRCPFLRRRIRNGFPCKRNSHFKRLANGKRILKFHCCFGIDARSACR